MLFNHRRTKNRRYISSEEIAEAFWLGSSKCRAFRVRSAAGADRHPARASPKALARRVRVRDISSVGRASLFQERAGFTLMEVIIVLGILSGLVLVVSFFALDVATFGIFAGESIEEEQEIQQTLKLMTPEIKSMTSSNSGNYAIEGASSASFSFYSDIDNDGLVEKVRYFLDSSVFKKGVIKPTINPIVYNPATEKVTEVVHNVVSGNIFYYYDENYPGSLALAPPVDVAVIRLIKVSLAVDKNVNTAPRPFAVSAFIDIRNLRGI